jgi:hypothetical protein
MFFRTVSEHGRDVAIYNVGAVIVSSCTTGGFSRRAQLHEVTQLLILIGIKLLKRLWQGKREEVIAGVPAFIKLKIMLAKFFVIIFFCGLTIVASVN